MSELPVETPNSQTVTEQSGDTDADGAKRTCSLTTLENVPLSIPPPTEAQPFNSNESGASEEQAPFYIEMDASAVASLKAGTQYTLVPVKDDEEEDALRTTLVDSDENKENQPWSVSTVPSGIHPVSEQVIDEKPSTEKLLSQTNKFVSCSNEPNLTFTTLTPLSHIQHGTVYPARLDKPPRYPGHFPMQNSTRGSATMYNIPPVRYHSNWTPYPQGQTLPAYSSNQISTAANMVPTSLTLNSSGEEFENSSGEYPRVYHNASANDVSRMGGIGPIPPQMVGPLDNMPYYIPFNGRENHNEKERKRRSRIKNACQNLRTLVPGLSDKTDKATVFEFTVQYLMHMKRSVGNKYDKDFMDRYSTY